MGNLIDKVTNAVFQVFYGKKITREEESGYLLKHSTDFILRAESADENFANYNTAATTTTTTTIASNPQSLCKDERPADSTAVVCRTASLVRQQHSTPQHSTAQRSGAAAQQRRVVACRACRTSDTA